MVNTSTKFCIFKLVVLLSLHYSLENAMLLNPQVHQLQPLVMRCIRTILRVSFRGGGHLPPLGRGFPTPTLVNHTYVKTFAPSYKILRGTDSCPQEKRGTTLAFADWRDGNVYPLHFLFHIQHMDDCHLPKQLPVSALGGGSRATGSQKLQWNDLVFRNLKGCQLVECWCELAHN